MKKTVLSGLLLGLLSGQAQALPEAAARVAESPMMGDIQLTQIRLDEAARLISQMGKTNVVVTGKVADQVASLYLRDASVEDVVRNLCRSAGVWYRYDAGSKTYVIMNDKEYQKDLAIVRDEKTQVFTLRHHNVVAAANAVKALFGARVTLSQPVEEMPPTSLGAGARRSGGGASTSTTLNSSTQGSTQRNTQTGGASSASTFGGASFDAAQQSGGRAGVSGQAGEKVDVSQLSQALIEGQGDRDGRIGQAEIQELLSRQGPAIYVTYNKLNNLLMVRSGDAAAMKQVAALLGELDRPPRQVLLEMQILEVILDDGFKSVFDMAISNADRTTSKGPVFPAGMSPAVPPPYAKNSAVYGNFPLDPNSNFVWQFVNNTIALRFQLMEQENKLRTLASPMLVAANNQVARLFIGDERVLVTGATSQTITGTTGANNTNITPETETRDIGQSLSILPRINDDRTISLTIDHDSSTVKIGDASIPVSNGAGDIIPFPIDTVTTANLQVTAHARDGMTVVIGGMIRENVDKQEAKVPVLGDLPGVGMLFKQDVRAANRAQLVLLITPRILENPEEAARLAEDKQDNFDRLAKPVGNANILPKLKFELPAPGASSASPAWPSQP